MIDSDPHNFGLKVSRQGDWVLKPRPVYWEWLFLGSNSPLRRLCEDKNRFSSSPFLGFPSIRYEFGKIGSLPFSGRAEFLQSSDLAKVSTASSYEMLGRTMAVALYFGIIDVHFENLFFLTNEHSKIDKIFPIDIEVVFEPLKLVSETHIIGAKVGDNWDIGMRNRFNETPNAAATIFGFYRSIMALNRETEQLQKTLDTLPIRKVPIRRLVRNTADYVHAKDSGITTDFYREELIQMERGDIPYFFTYLDQNKIFFLTEKGPMVAKIPWSKSGKNTFAVSASRCIRPLPKPWVKASVLQIARALLPRDREPTYHENVGAWRKDNQIYVSVGDSWKLKCST